MRGEDAYVGQDGILRRVGNPPGRLRANADQAECHSAAGCQPAPHNQYVAARGIQVYSPDGRLLHTIEMREAPSNCAFAEADLVITARGTLYRARMDGKDAR
jgi:hypothetical protein